MFNTYVNISSDSPPIVALCCLLSSSIQFTSTKKWMDELSFFVSQNPEL